MKLKQLLFFRVATDISFDVEVESGKMMGRIIVCLVKNSKVKVPKIKQMEKEF